MLSCAPPPRGRPGSGLLRARGHRTRLLRAPLVGARAAAVVVVMTHGRWTSRVNAAVPLREVLAQPMRPSLRQPSRLLLLGASAAPSARARRELLPLSSSYARQLSSTRTWPTCGARGTRPFLKRLPFARCEGCLLGASAAPSARARRELLPLSSSYARQLSSTRTWPTCESARNSTVPQALALREVRGLSAWRLRSAIYSRAARAAAVVVVVRTAAGGSGRHAVRGRPAEREELDGSSSARGDGACRRPIHRRLSLL